MRRHAWSLPLVHPRWLLIGLLVLACASCARRDWVSDLLVLTDVTGTWEGSTDVNTGGGSTMKMHVPITMVLQQSGPKVTGELSWSRGQLRVQGVVNGEVLAFSEGIEVELAVDGDEMWGRTENPPFGAAVFIGSGGLTCQPACFLHFRRAGAPVPARSEQNRQPGSSSKASGESRLIILPSQR
jgi:hypothetical protein